MNLIFGIHSIMRIISVFKPMPVWNNILLTLNMLCSHFTMIVSCSLHNITSIIKLWCQEKDSNLRPIGYEPIALVNWAILAWNQITRLVGGNYTPLVLYLHNHINCAHLLMEAFRLNASFMASLDGFKPSAYRLEGGYSIRWVTARYWRAMNDSNTHKPWSVAMCTVPYANGAFGTW